MTRGHLLIVVAIFTSLISVSAYATRTTEPLEHFDLSSLHLVLVSKDRKIANVQDPNGHVHLVKIGNYMGRNYGYVWDILDDRLMLHELYRMPDGEWENRDAVLVIDKQSSH